MARNLFSGDLALDTDGDPAGGVPFTWWSDPFGGNQITDVRAVDGTSAAPTSTLSNGVRPPLRGPDGVTAMWCDAGAGYRSLAVAANLFDDVALKTGTVYTGTHNFTGATVTGITGSGGADTLTAATSTGAVTVNAATATVHNLTLAANTTLTLTAPGAGPKSLTLWIRQNSTGGWSFTWPSSVKWSGGSPPSLPTTPNALSIVGLSTIDSGVTWVGFPAAEGVA